MVVNVWTHIVITYSSDNGLALYVNGNMLGVTTGFTSLNSYFFTQPYLTMGNARTSGSVPTCNSGGSLLAPGAYRGSIDELRIYSRELSINDICSLYNS